jgi:hypothetical protein
MVVGVVGCNNNAKTPSTPMGGKQVPTQLTALQDLTVLYYPHLIEVPEKDFDKAAMLSNLKQQQFRESAEKPPGLPGWRILAYAHEKEPLQIDLYGMNNELAYDAENSRYFYWKYWSSFMRELVNDKSEIAKRFIPQE